jgi:hypothetical protein
VEKIPEYSYFIIKEGRGSIEKNGFLTYKELLLAEGEKYQDKRPKYTEEELKVMVSLVFLTLVYRNHTVKIEKKVISLIDHIVRN